MATTLTLYEYTDCDDRQREPIEPAFKRTPTIAMGTPIALAAATRYVTIKATGGNCNVRLTRDSSQAATTDDHYIAQNGEASFPVIRQRHSAGQIFVNAV